MSVNEAYHEWVCGRNPEYGQQMLKATYTISTAPVIPAPATKEGK